MSATFESARLRMRPTQIDDAEALHQAYCDPQLMQWWSSGPHADVAETHAYLAQRLDQAGARGWTITRQADDVAIGTLWAGAKRPGVSEIGYMLVRSAWGQGYAQEAVTRLIDLLLREEGQRRIFADTDPDNSASNRLLERLGFVQEGRLRGEWETHIGVRDSFIWGLLADDWIKR